MTRILIGNDFPEELRGDRGWAGWWVQRVAWFARDDDILVVPVAPEEQFLQLVTSLTGVRRESLKVVVPPPGREERTLLNSERLSKQSFHSDLRNAIAGRTVEEVFPLWPDAAVARLARAIGVLDALPGGRFIEQDGGRLLNSKSVFRAVAAGVGIPLPDGAVCATPEAMKTAITELLGSARTAVVKQDYLSGGRGNEIVTRGERFRPIGARRVVVLADDSAVSDYVDQRWDALTDEGRSLLIIEEYLRDSASFFAEFVVTDDGVELGGTGEMLYAPFVVGEVMPAVALDEELTATLVEQARRLCEAAHAMGYRGTLSPDAVATPDRRIVFTEWNGRITGSTHIYAMIGHRVVGDGYGRDRFILERAWPPGWAVESFAAAVERLEEAKLLYDPATRKGVVLTNAFDIQYRGVMYCIVVENLDDGWRQDRELAALFTAR